MWCKVSADAECVCFSVLYSECQYCNLKCIFSWNVLGVCNFIVGDFEYWIVLSVCVVDCSGVLVDFYSLWKSIIGNNNRLDESLSNNYIKDIRGSILCLRSSGWGVRSIGKIGMSVRIISRSEPLSRGTCRSDTRLVPAMIKGLWTRGRPQQASLVWSPTQHPNVADSRLAQNNIIADKDHCAFSTGVAVRPMIKTLWAWSDSGCDSFRMQISTPYSLRNCSSSSFLPWALSAFQQAYRKVLPVCPTPHSHTQLWRGWRLWDIARVSFRLVEGYVRLCREHWQLSAN